MFSLVPQIKMADGGALDEVLLAVYWVCVGAQSEQIWEPRCGSPAMRTIVSALQEKVRSSGSEHVKAACLGALVLADVAPDQEFALEAVAQACTMPASLNGALYQSLRYALAAGLLDSRSYEEICGGASMTPLDHGILLRLAEAILRPAGRALVTPPAT
ncbi:hypothetical protein [Andreprevotia lacus]|uniref:hypothetical protein n=1 Tax=Andreprevotia lacus TaxID=1121000 RepID=UPI001594693B|nr:hypothetical protein [Andreprevotia lacus]